MGKTKDKKNQKVENTEPLITEEERNNNPIFKTIYKRIRNLNKKLATIDNLEEQNPSTLKPEQINKINSRDEVEN